MRTTYILVALFLGWGMKLEEVPLCIPHGGTCGCNMGNAVCCDGYLVYGGCR